MNGELRRKPSEGSNIMSNGENMAESPAILIVDDEEPILKILSAILENEGYECFLAQSATAARDVLRSNDITLILSDIEMPGESGPDFIRFVF